MCFLDKRDVRNFSSSANSIYKRVVKTKFGLSAAYAYDFGVPNGLTAVTRSGNEIFLKFNF